MLRDFMKTIIYSSVRCEQTISENNASVFNDVIIKGTGTHLIDFPLFYLYIYPHAFLNK